MTDHPAELARLRRFAAAVLRELPAAAHSAADRATIDHLVGRARTLHRRSSGRLSGVFAGEYSSGKSSLISMLLDRPGLLPADVRPTTSTPTAVRLHPKPHPSAVARTSVVLQSRESVARMTAILVDQLVALGRAHTLSAGRLTALAGYQPLTEGWARFDELGRQLWRGGQLNDSVQAGITGLARLRDALHVGGALLAESESSPELAIDRDAADGLRVGRGREFRDRFPEPTEELAVPPNATLGAALLTSIQPLVERLVYDVDVPVGLWGFGELLAEPGIEFTDLAGLGTDSAADEFLAQRELARATALVVVVDAAAKPERVDAINKLLGFLERERHSLDRLRESRLAVANRFDGLPALDTDTERPSQLALSLLNTMTKLTHGRPGEAVYTSVCAALAARGLPVPATEPPVTAESLAAHRAHWAAVAAARPAEPEAPLWRAYADDGGLDELRRRLVDRLERSGLAIHVGELRAIEREIRDGLARLVAGRPRPPADPTDAARRLRACAAELRDTAGALRERLATVRDPAALRLRDGRGLDAALVDEIVTDVYGWTAWPDLVEHVGVDNAVDVGGTPDDRSLPVVTSARELVPDFDEAVRRADRRLAVLLTEAVEAWAGAEPGRAGPVLDEDLLDLIRTGVPDADGPATVARLRGLADRSFVADEIARLVAELATERAADGLFPLDADRGLPWHPDRPRADEGDDWRARHVTGLLRTRHDVAASIVEHARRRLAAALHELAIRLLAALQQRVQDIPSGREIRRIVADAATRDPAAATDDPIHRLLDTDPPPDLPTPDLNGATP